MLLADFGADVVKVEQPRPRRSAAPVDDRGRAVLVAGLRAATSASSRSTSSRPRAVELLDAAGAAIRRRDGVVRPGHARAARASAGTCCSAWNPKLILVRISGWGQTGPASQRPGFGTLVEAASGFAAMNGEPDGAPIVPAFPARRHDLGALRRQRRDVRALSPRRARRRRAGGRRLAVRVAVLAARSAARGVRGARPAARAQRQPLEERRPARLLPRRSDGRYIAVSGSTPKMAERFLQAYGLGDLLEDPRFATNEARVAHADELDALVAGADRRAHARREPAHHRRATRSPRSRCRPSPTSSATRTGARASCCSTCPTAHGTVRMHNVVPRLSATPGRDPPSRAARSARTTTPSTAPSSA